MFTSTFLRGVIKKALRNGLWYKVLNELDRALLVLTSRTVDVVRSVTLGIVIVKILAKLKKASKSSFVRYMECFGVMEAKKIAAQAIAFGRSEAESWAHDMGFVRFLTVMKINSPMGFP